MKTSLAVLLVFCLCVSACSSRKTVTRPSAAAVMERVEEGDVVRIQARNGKTYSLEVTEVADTYLRGYEAQTRKRYKIPFSQVEKMEYEGYSGTKTATGTVVLVGGALLILGAMLDAIGDSFGESFDNLFNGGGC